MKEKIIKGIFVGGVCVFGGYVIKKLNDIHQEIMYFEEAKGLWTKKERDRILSNRDPEIDRKILEGLK